MATWSALLQRARRRYGLESLADDALLNDLLFLDRVNEILREFALKAGGFREEFTVNLPTTAAVALSPRVIRILDDTLRIDYDGDGIFEIAPQLVPEQTLRKWFGVLETADAGTPAYFYMQRGSTAESMVNLVLYPRSDTAQTSGIKLAARTTPAAITTGTDSLPLQEGEEPYLIPGICLALAETELSRGRKDAPIELWERRWEQAKTDYTDFVEDTTRVGRRVVQYLPDGDEAGCGYY